MLEQELSAIAGRLANIPSAAGRETGAAVIGTNSAVAATDSYHLDWLAVYFTTARTR